MSPSLLSLMSACLMSACLMSVSPMSAAEGTSPWFGLDGPLDHVSRALRDKRAVLIVGPAGVGKTTLAQAQARVHRKTCDSPSWWCDLRAARDRDELIVALGAALGQSLFCEDLGQDLAELIELRLAQDADALLILDNAERVTDALVPLLTQWADRGSLPQIIVTTRHAFALAGAATIRCQPLSPGDARDLYLARARALRPSFQIEDEQALSELLARHDALPLAIELLAARAPQLGERALLEATPELACLEAGHALHEPLHRSLQAALDWSWSCLAPEDAALLAQCLAFRGSWTVQDARQVLGPGAVGALTRALDWSLMQRRLGPDGSPRFALYESVREHIARVCGPPSLQVRSRHAAHVVRAALARAQRLDHEDARQALAALRDSEAELLQVIAQDDLEPEPRLDAQRALAAMRMRVGPAPKLLQALDEAVEQAVAWRRPEHEVELRVARLRAVNLLSLISRVHEDAQALAAMPSLRPAHQIEAALWGASDLVCTGRIDEASRALASLRQREDASLSQRAMILVASMVTALGAADRALARQLDAQLDAHRARAGVSAHDALAMMRAQSLLGESVAGRAGRVVELAQDMLRLVDLLAYESVRPEIMIQAALAHVQLDQTQIARELLTQAADLAQRHGMRGAHARALLHLGHELELGAGRPEQALALIEQARRLASQAGQRGRALRCELARVDATLALGLRPEAARLLEQLHAQTAQHSWPELRAQLEHRGALLKLLDGELPEAIARWRALASAEGPLRASATAYLAAALAADGEPERAQEVLQTLPEHPSAYADAQRVALLRVALTPRLFRQEPLARALSAPQGALGCADASWLVPWLMGQPSSHEPFEAAPALQAQPALARPIVQIGPAGRWVQLPGQPQRVELSRKEVLARLIDGLATQAADSPGHGLDVEDLLSLGWPGQTLLARAGANRVYVALNNLRKLGLDQLIVRTRQGYMINPHVQIERVDSEPDDH